MELEDMLSCALTHLGDMPVRSKQTGGQVISSLGANHSLHFAVASVA